VTFGATLKAGKKTSKIADLFVSETLIDVGPGFSVLEIDLAQKHLQPFGFVQRINLRSALTVEIQ
jgi:acyl-coenzyme A thioesterase PaaI-like protein